jgi:hypothetical protein
VYAMALEQSVDYKASSALVLSAFEEEPVATFTWKAAGTSGDWNTAADWTLTGGTGTPPPGSTSADSDIAQLGASRHTAYTVTIFAGETFDVAEVDIAGGRGSRTTTLSISGSLLTDSLSISGGPRHGSVIVNTGGSLNIRDDLTARRAETITIAAGAGTGGFVELGSSTNSGIHVNDRNVTFSFSSPVSGPSTGKLEYNGPAFEAGSTTKQHITDLTWGDSIVFDHASFTNDTFIYSKTTDTLTVKTPLNDTYLTMHNVSGVTPTSLESADFVGVGDTIEIVCFAAGTHICTPTDERPIESLTSGDIVNTLADGQLRACPVKWIGRRRIDLTAHPRPELVAPIRIQRGAFDENAPHTDLLLSPDHAIFVEDKLICASQLVNGTTIRQQTDLPSIEYFHIELDTHAILLAEGLPVESYLNTGNKFFFTNSDTPLVLHPNLTDETDYPTREAGSCVPFVWDEASVRPVWQRLADRGAALGQSVPQRATTTEAKLRVRCSTGECAYSEPTYVDSNLVIFVLPRGSREIRLISRSQSPTEARPWLADRRKLGVKVKRIVLRNAKELCEIPIDNPGLTKGWWDIECDKLIMSRWTDGNAVVPLPEMDGSVLLLELHLAGEMIYALETEIRAEHRAAA